MLVPYSNFYIPPIHIAAPLLSSHFPPLLPTFLYPLTPLWKMWKIMWKTCPLSHKYSINHRKIPANAPKIVLGYLACFFYFLFVRYFIWILLRILACFRSVVPLVYWEPMVPIPSFARKDFQSFLLVPSLRSGRRQTVFHLSNLTVLK